MATIPVSPIIPAGTLVALVPANPDGDALPNDGATFLEVDNAGDQPVTLTLTRTLDGERVPGRTLAVAPGKRLKLGPFPTTTWNDANGLIEIAYSGVTDDGRVTVAGYRF